MSIASEERTLICDLFAELGPDQPTLCAGWTTGDLAAHLWLRENDPVAAGGILFKPLSGHTERRMSEVLADRQWAELVERLRQGPGQWSVFRLPGVDEGANATEFFIHAEDVRRAQRPPLPARTLSAEAEDGFWRRLKVVGRAMFRRLDCGLVLERIAEGEQAGEGAQAGEGEQAREVIDQLRVRPGQVTVTVQGLASELLLLASGRGEHAAVTVVGDDAGVAALKAAQLGL